MTWTNKSSLTYDRLDQLDAATLCRISLMKEYEHDGKYWWHKLCCQCQFNRSMVYDCEKGIFQVMTAYKKKNNCDNFTCEKFKKRCLKNKSK